MSLLVSACSAGAGTGDFGATPGGVKDLALARAKVEAGQIPTLADLPFEGAYSEHDLPVEGAPCNTALCLRAAGVEVDGSTWVHLGLSSGVSMAQFHRPTLNAVVVLDNSGSMGVEKMEAAKGAAERLIDLLGPDDTLAVVRFDTFSAVLVESAPVIDRERFKKVVRGIKASGSTCIECGLRDAFAQLTQAQSLLRSNRVFLFTDAQPNVAATGAGEFIDLLEAAAKREQYVTLFGVGLDFGQDLVTRISAVKGASATFLATPEQVRKVFDEDFDLMVTPLAFDMTLKLAPVDGLVLADMYGVPAQSGAAYESHVATVFLSRRRGAIVARFEGVSALASPAEASLKYTVSPSVNLQALGIRAQATLEAHFAVTTSQTPAIGTARVVTLTRALISIRAACEAFHTKRVDEARAQAKKATSLLTDARDPDLDNDLVFATHLEALLAR